MICPCCDMDINDNAIDLDDGCCPECGASLSTSLLFDDDSYDIDELEEDLDFDEDDF